MSRNPLVFIGAVTLAVFAQAYYVGAQRKSTGQPASKTRQVHQKGNVPIFEGHELHKYPIYITQHLSPGHHELGSLQLEGIGPVQISVEVNKNGEVVDINSRWPEQVKPEVLSRTTHDVYYYAPGQGIQVAGKAYCWPVHAGGNCPGCSTYNWLEISDVKLR